MANADPERVAQELKTLFDFERNRNCYASGKTGIGIHDILDAIIERIPAPTSTCKQPLKALLFDSWFDDYRGVICLIAVKDGIIKKGDHITLAQTGKEYEVLELGLMYPDRNAHGCFICRTSGISYYRHENG